MKPIFENKDECRKFLKDIFLLKLTEEKFMLINQNESIEVMTNEAHQKGYIKKSELEQAKEDHERHNIGHVPVPTMHYIKLLEINQK